VLTALAIGRRVPDAQEYLVRDLSKRDYVRITHTKNEIAARLFKEFILQTGSLEDPPDTEGNIFSRLWTTIKAGLYKFK